METKSMTMADVLNQSWGGPGFAGYEGRMEDDAPMDSDARVDAALAAFSGDEGGDPNSNGVDPNAADPNAADPGADPNAADPNAADPNADPNAGQLTDEQLQADPRFQELSTLKDNVANLAAEFNIPLDDKGMPDLNETKLQLSDASVLYDIMSGKGTPSALLETMAANAGWTDQQKQLVAQDLIGWLTKSGYLKDGAAADGKKPVAGAKPGDAGFVDPVNARLDKIENDNKTAAQRAEQARVQAHQREVFDTKFMPKITDLCKQKGVPQEDVADYANRVASLINGNPQITKRIEQGNYVDVQRLFTQIHNAEVARLKRWTDQQTAAKNKQNRNPRIPSGGAPPAPAGSAKPVNVRDRDSRLAAAAELL
jgi:hypothetical protein